VRADFSKDGERVVIASSDKTAMVWDARTGAHLASLEGHTARLIKATFSGDGARVLTTSADHAAKLSDARARDVVRRRWRGGVHAVFSPDSDGARVMTVSIDRRASSALAIRGRSRTAAWCRFPRRSRPPSRLCRTARPSRQPLPLARARRRSPAAGLAEPPAGCDNVVR
jgi:hypothetical protein